MDPKTRAMFAKVTKGAMAGKAGEKPIEEFKINGQYVNTPVIDGKKASLEFRSLMSISRRQLSSTSTRGQSPASRSS
jgi:hypothetical protein